MIVAVIIVFTVCWTPFQIVLVLKAFGLYDDHKYESLVIFEIIMRCLAYGNSCLNPLLYAFFSPNFRSAFIQALSLHTNVGSVSSAVMQTWLDTVNAEDDADKPPVI